MLGLVYQTKSKERGAPMYNSIQHFIKEGTKDLEKIFIDYSADLTKIAEMVYGVTDGVVSLGLSIMAEELEMYDEYLRKSTDRKKNWYIVRRDETTLLTSLGSITYHKTLFKNKETGSCEYLLDRYMGLEKHARMTEDAEAKILEEAVESSYRKGGENASIGLENVSRETVMNKIHVLRFPLAKPQGEKKQLRYLYIDCDEDHVSLQYLDKKGDIRKRRRSNTIMPKIVYVYEGITNENGRNELVNARYFGGVYEGTEGNRVLWDEVWDYIDGSYDTEYLKKIFVNGDGAVWIKSGARLLDKGKFVLDKFHMHKYIIGATSHLLECVEDTRSKIYGAIRKRRKKYAEGVFKRILNVTEGESRIRTVEAARTYILENWTGIMEQQKNKDAEIECSAEGHVSHVFADRMSSRPLGWSKTGADKMAHLRIYYYNKGNMLELVRYQSQEWKQAAGAELPALSAGDMIKMENADKKRLGSMADMPVYTIPYPQIKKIANFKNHIWGL